MNLRHATVKSHDTQTGAVIGSGAGKYSDESSKNVSMTQLVVLTLHLWLT